MKRLGRLRPEQGGFTIIETLIVLACSAALVITVMGMISGQQGKAVFSQAVRDADSRFQDLVNDYSTGYSASGAGISCTADDAGGAPALVNNPAGQQGKSFGCVYVGRVLQIVNGGRQYTTHTIVGRQYTGAVFSSPTSDLTSARAILSYPYGGFSGRPNLSRTEDFNGGIELSRAVYLNGSAESPIGAFGIISNFGNSPGGTLASDKQSPQLMILTGSYSDSDELALEFDNGLALGTDHVLNKPMALCFLSNSSDQHAVIRFGTATGGTGSITTIGGGRECPPDLIP